MFISIEYFYIIPATQAFHDFLNRLIFKNELTILPSNRSIRINIFHLYRLSRHRKQRCLIRCKFHFFTRGFHSNTNFTIDQRRFYCSFVISIYIKFRPIYFNFHTFIRGNNKRMYRIPCHPKIGLSSQIYLPLFSGKSHRKTKPRERIQPNFRSISQFQLIKSSYRDLHRIIHYLLIHILALHLCPHVIQPR